MGLIDMQSRRDLASTGYALDNPGSEYLVLEPDSAGAAFTVNLPTLTAPHGWDDEVGYGHDQNQSAAPPC
jgi:hypothetical protein